jgi:exonuclease SbcC
MRFRNFKNRNDESSGCDRMIIEHITFKNFKRFENIDIDFKNEIYGIIGNNGTGKSSLVEGIFFTLFGVSDKSIQTDYIVSAFAIEKSEMYMKFQQDDITYEIFRTYSKSKQHTAQLKANDEIRATGVSQVDTKIRKILGMGPNDFRNTIYAAQKDLLTLLDLTPGKRKEWFLRALGIDYLNTGCQKILKESIDKKEKEHILLQSELTILNRQDPNEINQLRDLIKNLEQKATNLKTEEVDTINKRDLISKDLDVYNTQSNTFNNLLKQKTSLQGEISVLEKRLTELNNQILSNNIDEHLLSSLEQQIATLPDTRKKYEEFRTKQTSIESIQLQIKTLEKDIHTLDSKILSLNNTLKTYDTHSKKIKILYGEICSKLCIDSNIQDNLDNIDDIVSTILKDNQKQHTTLVTRLESLEREEKVLVEKYNTINIAGKNGNCPLCRQPLGDHYKDIEQEYITRLESIGTECKQIRCEIAEVISKDLAIVDDWLKEIQKLKNTIQNREYIENELLEYESKKQTTTKNIDDLNNKIILLDYNEQSYIACKNLLENLESTQIKLNFLNKQLTLQAVAKTKISEVNSQIAIKNTELQYTLTEIGSNPLDTTIGDNLKSKLSEVNLLLSNISNEISVSTERIQNTDEKIKSLSKSLGHLESLKSRVSIITNEIEILKLTRSTISDYIIYIAQVVRSQIESEVSSLISMITNGKYDRVSLDEDFNLLVHENGKDYSVNRFSGGEQDDVAVALRIALSRYLSKLHNVSGKNLLIFDEIFGSQDEERRGNLLNMLRTIGYQIFLISHISEMQGEFENTLVVKSDGIASTVQECI